MFARRRNYPDRRKLTAAQLAAEQKRAEVLAVVRDHYTWTNGPDVAQFLYHTFLDACDFERWSEEHVLELVRLCTRAAPTNRDLEKLVKVARGERRTMRQIDRDRADDARTDRANARRDARREAGARLTPRAAAPRAAEPQGGKVIDLMDALKASIYPGYVPSHLRPPTGDAS